MCYVPNFVNRKCQETRRTKLFHQERTPEYVNEILWSTPILVDFRVNPTYVCNRRSEYTDPEPPLPWRSLTVPYRWVDCKVTQTKMVVVMGGERTGSSETLGVVRRIVLTSWNTNFPNYDLPVPTPRLPDLGPQVPSHKQEDEV